MSNKSIPLNISTILIIEKTKKFGTLYGRTSLSDESVGLFLHELEMLKVIYDRSDERESASRDYTAVQLLQIGILCSWIILPS